MVKPLCVLMQAVASHLASVTKAARKKANEDILQKMSNNSEVLPACNVSDEGAVTPYEANLCL